MHRSEEPSTADYGRGADGRVQGMIFDIKRFAIYDGPGIRTTVFAKGCPLSCLWCHNPEGISKDSQLTFEPERCIGCGRCLGRCPEGVHQLVGGQHTVLWEKCRACGTCTRSCYAGALRLVGRRVSVSDVMHEVTPDRPLYEASRGGVTLSGGEPLAQPTFSRALLRTAKAEGLHTALDTSGFAPWRHLEGLLPFVDLVLYDLKHMDAERHIACTGVSNLRILENLRRLDASGQTSWVRIPLVSGYNDGDGNFRALGQFLSQLRHVERVEILCYHRLAESKYPRIGRPYPLCGLEPPTAERAASRRDILLGFGLSSVVCR